MTDDEYKLVTAKTPLPCVDLVILRTRDGQTETLLLTRKIGLTAGKWCLIGGRIQLGETMEEAITRQAADLGVTVAVVNPFHAGFPALVNSNSKHDATKHYVASVYPVRIVHGTVGLEGKEYKGFEWFRIDQLPDNIAYDHREEITKTIKQMKTLGAHL